MSTKIVNLVASKAIFGSNLGLLKKITVVSLGESNITKGTVESININSATQKALTGFTKKVCDSFFTYADTEYIQVLELGATGTTPDTLAEQTAKIGTMIEQGQLSSYITIVPEAMWKDTAFATLVSGFNDVNKMNYFVGVVPFNYNFTPGTELTRLKNMKSCIMIYDMLKDSSNTSVAGIFAGIYMSKFQISDANTMRAFDYIFINSNIKDIDKTKSDKLEEFNVVYFAEITGKPGFFNVKCMDGEHFDYYIAFDNTSINIVDAVTNTLVNANNTANGALVFDNNSILLIKSVIETQLNNAKRLKLISEFGATYDVPNKAITNQNEIAYVDFADYIKSSIDKYNDGLYDAYSFNLRISKWILKVNLSTNLY